MNDELHQRLRDDFAKAAMTGILAGCDDETIIQHRNAQILAEQAYLVADAMLKERAK